MIHRFKTYIAHSLQVFNSREVAVTRLDCSRRAGHFGVIQVNESPYGITILGHNYDVFTADVTVKYAAFVI